MPPEQQQNQYIEQAKLADLSEELKKLRDNPASFDEQALKKEFRERLDKVVGKKQLDAPMLKKYQEALRKIDDSIARLREMRDYAVARTRMVEMERYVKNGGLPKDVPASIRYVQYISDYQDLVNFISNRPPLIIGSDEYLKDIDRARLALKDVGKLMAQHYDEKFKTLGKTEDERVRNLMERGGLKLVDYLDLDDAQDELTELLRDKGQTLDKWGTKNPALDALQEQAVTRLMSMGETLAEARKFLNREDRFAVNNFDRAMAMRGEGAREMQENASIYRAMLYNKQLAEKNRMRALATGTDPETYNEADRIFARAEGMTKRNPTEAQKLFFEAGNTYNQAHELYLAQQRKKKPGRQGPDRLARR